MIAHGKARIQTLFGAVSTGSALLQLENRCKRPIPRTHEGAEPVLTFSHSILASVAIRLITFKMHKFKQALKMAFDQPVITENCFMQVEGSHRLVLRTGTKKLQNKFSLAFKSLFKTA